MYFATQVTLTDWCEGGIGVMERSRGKDSIAKPLMTFEF